MNHDTHRMHTSTLSTGMSHLDRFKRRPDPMELVFGGIQSIGSPFVCFAEGDAAPAAGGAASGEGGTGAPAEVTFSPEQQAKVDAIVASRVGIEARKFQAANQKLEEALAAIESQKQAIAERDAKLEDMNASDIERERNELQRRVTALETGQKEYEQQREAAIAERDEARGQLNTYRIDAAIRTELLKLKVRPDAMQFATEALSRFGNIKIAEDGAVAGELSGAPADLQTITGRFIEENRYLLPPSAGGGTPRPNGPGAVPFNGEDVDKSSASSLIARGLQRRSGK